jgi:ABC-type multidrug transport system ATPase subunit
MTNAISMTGLTKRYKGVQALTDLTLDVPSGRYSASSARTAPARRPR